MHGADTQSWLPPLQRVRRNGSPRTLLLLAKLSWMLFVGLYNITPKNRLNSKIVGVVFLLISIGLALILIFTGVKRWWRIFVFLPYGLQWLLVVRRLLSALLFRLSSAIIVYLRGQFGL